MSGTYFEDEYRYAWDWFSYHASQRLVTFRFFLILEGVILAGYIQTRTAADMLTTPAILAVLGCIVALAFLALDIRNEELANYGLDAIRELEKSFVNDELENNPILIQARGGGRHKLWAKNPRMRRLCRGSKTLTDWMERAITHGFMFRAVFALSILGFVIAIIELTIQLLR